MNYVEVKIEKYIEKVNKEMKFYSAEEMIKTFTAYTFFRDRPSGSNDFISAKSQMLVGYAMKSATNVGKYDYTYLSFEKIIKLADKIFELYSETLTHKNDDVTQYSKESKERSLVESLTKTKYMFYRKEGYTVPVMMFGRDLYKPIESKLQEVYGFAYIDLERFYMYVIKIYKNRLKKYLKDREKFIKSMDTLCHNIYQKEADIQLGEFVQKIFKGEFFEIKKSELFKKIGEQKVNEIIKRFGVEFKNGLNKNYKYPVDFNEILSTPILDFGEYIIMPDIRFGLVNLPKLLHYDLIGRRAICNDENKYKELINEYSKYRGEVIENCVEKFFNRLFLHSNVYKSLRYGKNQDCEADITIDYGEIIIVCECKGKLLNLSSAKGDYDSIKDDFNKAIQDSYNQACRTQEFIRAGENFYYNKNQISLNKDAKIIKICITAENYGYISSNPMFLLNIKQDDEYPIIFNIHDLNVITDELKTAKEMIDYLQFRENLSCRVHTIEEIDTLIAYKNNLTDKTDTVSSYMFLGITDGINQRYLKKGEKFIEDYKI